MVAVIQAVGRESEAERTVVEAHRRATSASPAEMATYLASLLGQHLTAMIAGLDNPKTVGRWMRGQAPHPAHARRLRDAYQIAQLLELGESRQTAQSWFIGMNPILADRAPALVLADDEQSAPKVMQAARAYLAHG
jgi:hypothetical protein